MTTHVQRPPVVQFLGGVIATSLLFPLAARILGEEKMLRTELEGYAEYEQKVRYRVIPYVW